MDGSGGLGAVSVGITESAVFLILAVLALFGVWKVAKLIWAALAE
jgi:hypothetical protein